MTEQQDGTLIPNPTFHYYQQMTDHLGGSLKAIKRLQTSNDSIFFLFEITREDDSIVFVVWERRDQFYGEEEPPASLTFGVPWSAARISELFKDESLEIHSIPDGLILEIRRETNVKAFLDGDVARDSTHPSIKGRIKVANLLMDFVKSDTMKNQMICFLLQNSNWLETGYLYA
ncbi:MAG: hypothetical protein ACE5IY_13930 [bacterium]